MSGSGNELLGGLLKGVSRSFYLTLRVLPGPLQRPIGLGYLLARTSDTIADTDLVPFKHRVEALEQFRERVMGRDSRKFQWSGLSLSNQGPERELLLRIEEALDLFHASNTREKNAIQKVLTTIISGQLLDLSRFENASAQNVIALSTYQETDDYTFRVAGCVGDFWTTICHLAYPHQRVFGDHEFISQGVRFGKGLQLINILRDLPRDLRQGRCYLPQEGLAKHQVRPDELLITQTQAKIQPLFNEFLNQAQNHLRSGWTYTLRIPSRYIRLRLACAWPILIGISTLNRLRAANLLDPNLRIKIPRSEVKGIILSSLVRYPWQNNWAQQFDKRLSCV